MPIFTDSTINSIKARLTMSEVVQSYIPVVTRSGRSWAKCPFHGNGNERTPSFAINDKDGFYHCFGCGESGDMFTFVEKMDHVGFAEAVEILARKAGVEIETTAGTAVRKDRDEAERLYPELKLPKRATKGSAGYDIYSPIEFELKAGEEIMIPTGMRCLMDESAVLLIVPRSSLGFKYRFQLNNTVGVIDSDYFYSDNEGHIFIRFTNDSKTGAVLRISRGQALAQGIFVSYGITEDDDTEDIRNGGIGSTDRLRGDQG